MMNFSSFQLSSSFSSAKSYELLHRMQGKGLSGSFKFTRGPCIYGTNMVAVEVTLVNNSDTSISNIHVGEKVQYVPHHFLLLYKQYYYTKCTVHSFIACRQ